MLPDDIKDLFPKALTDNINADGQALLDILNNEIATYKSNALGLQSFKDFARCPSMLLPELNLWLQADFKAFDNDRQKRQKLKNAIKSHKNRGLWELDVKPYIDNITGEDSSLYSYPDGNDNLFCGDGVIGLGTNMSTFGDDGINSFGESLIGSGKEVQQAGVVWIDLGFDENELYYIPDFDNVVTGDGIVDDPANKYSSVSDGTADGFGVYVSVSEDPLDPSILAFINQLAVSLKSRVPAYFRVFLGIINKVNKFVILVEV